MVELLIAMAVGLTLVAGVAQLFLNSKKTYRMQEAVSHMQANGRFAISYLSRELRVAGFQGCPNLSAIQPNVLVSNAPPVFDLNSALKGYDYEGSDLDGFTEPVDLVADTDIITTQRASSCRTALGHDMASFAAAIKIVGVNACQLLDDDVVMITDCSSVDIFQATNIQVSGGTTTVTHAASGNTSPQLSKAYSQQTDLVKFMVKDFYIKESNTGIYALFERDIHGNEDILIEGVDDMQISYGVEQTLSNSMVFMDAEDVSTANLWPSVKSIKIDLLLSTIEDNIVNSPQTYQFMGTSTTATDRRIRRTFSTTVSLRNR